MFAGGNPEEYLVGDDALEAFMAHCANRVGESYFRTPRTTIKQFVNLLAVLEQNPGVDWTQLVEEIQIAPEVNPDLAPLADDATPFTPPAPTLSPGAPSDPDDDDLTTLRL